MKITEISIGMVRGLRHRQYMTSQPEAHLTGRVEEDEDVNTAVQELKEDLFILMDSLCEKEVEDDRKRREIIKNAKRNSNL